MTDYRPLMEAICTAIANHIHKKRLHTAGPSLRKFWGKRAQEAGNYQVFPKRKVWMASPSVNHMLSMGYRPKDTHRLAFEYPVELDGRITFVPSERYGIAERTQELSPERYLNRTFDAPAHVIRDAAAYVRAKNNVRFTTDYDEIVSIVNDPRVYSCMGKFDHADHPYQCYTAELGWKLAYRVENDKPVARALVYEKGKHKCFVRTYTGNSGNSKADTDLAAYLKRAGYEHAESWPNGAQIAVVDIGGGKFIAPYLDGEDDVVTLSEDRTCFDITLYADDDESWKLDDAGGTIYWRDTVAALEESWECPNCGETHTGEDATDARRTHGYHDEEEHCSNCEDQFVEVQGRNGRTYNIHQNGVTTTVEGEDFDYDYLDDNDIVQLDYGRYEGEYTHTDRVVYDVDGNRWHDDDVTSDVGDGGYIIRCADGEYREADSVFRCAYDDEVYPDSEREEVEKDGETVYVHEDNVEAWKEENMENENESET